MIVRFLPGIVLLQLAVCSCGQTGTELGEQLLRKIDEQAAAAREAKPAGDIRSLQVASSALREALAASEERPPGWTRLSAAFRSLSDSLKEYSELAVAAKEWTEVQTKRLTEWEAAASKEMEMVARAATAKLRPARQPADLDEALDSLAAVAARYPYDASAQTWGVWGAAARNIAAVRSFMYSWQSLLAAEAVGEKREAASILGLASAVESVPALAGSELLALRREAAARLGVPSIDDADKAVRAAIEKALKVENAAELDETLDQLNFARRNYERASTRDTSERSPMRVFELGSRFIVGWQKFLVYRAAGNVGMAKLAVQELARTAETEPLYPHARLLEMTQLASQPPKGAPADEGSPADKILASIKTLDDIEPNLPAFKKAAEADMARFHTVDHDLETLMTAAAAVKHGDFSRTSMALVGGFNRHPKIPELRQQLALQLMAGILDAKGETAPKPSETAKQLAHRLANDARERKAWGRLREILEAPGRYHTLNDTFAPSDTVAVRTFMAGQNMEDAAVWQEAASSYIAALKTGSTFIPVDAIKQRLELLRKQHPQEYARAVEQSSNIPKTP